MKILSACALAVLLMGGSSRLHAGLVYLDDNAGNIFVGDPTTGNYTTVGNTGILGGFIDIGFAAGVVGLTNSTSGTLIAGGQGNIYSINTTTGAGTIIGAGGSYATSGDVDFDGSGNLYLTSTIPNADELFLIDQVTGAGTDIGPLEDLGGDPYSSVFGMVYDSDNGIMYGFETGGSQFDVNLADPVNSGDLLLDTGTVAGDTGLLGAAFVSTPEPSTFVLIGSALLAFAIPRRRREKPTAE